MTGVEVFEKLHELFGEAVSLPSAAEGEDPLHVSTTDIILLVDPEKLLEIAHSLKERLGYDYLITLTAVDFPERKELELLYFLTSLKTDERVQLKCVLPREDAEIMSLTPIWRAAEYPEREVYDLFGVRFRSHPDLRRIFLEDDFSGHPMLRDWEGEELLRLPEVSLR